VATVTDKLKVAVLPDELVPRWSPDTCRPPWWIPRRWPYPRRLRGEGEPGREGTRLCDGGGRVSGGRDRVGTRQPRDEGGSRGRRDGRRLGVCQGEGLGGRTCRVGGRDGDRVAVSGSGRGRSRDGGRAVAVVDQGDPGRQGAGLGDGRGRRTGGGHGGGEGRPTIEVAEPALVIAGPVCSVSVRVWPAGRDVQSDSWPP